ncbi:MAG: hypothetical protein MJZ64_07885 [Paludibacteraceae bacterium]|nr:hypothetical protein [Paludibacteraceae bacterium]
MKKGFVLFSMALSCGSLLGSGLSNNTNQSAAYLRNPVRETAIAEDGVFYNPAGTAFLSNGIHVNVNWQMAYQNRDVTYDCPVFALGEGNTGASKTFRGKMMAPVIPSVFLTYNWDRWNIQAGFNIVGGGGKCKYKEGVGMFELAVGQLMTGKDNKAEVIAKIQQQIPSFPPDAAMQYGMKMSLTGASYIYGVTLGTSYEIIKDHLSVSLGVRGVYMNNIYTGDVTNLAMNFSAVGIPPIKVNKSDNPKLGDLHLDCEQKGFGVTPMIGIDYRINEHWNLSAKVEVQTYINLKNKSSNSPMVDTLVSNYADGKRVRNDLPTIFNISAEYSPISAVRIGATYHYYDEKHAKKSADDYDSNKGTHECAVGLDWDACKYITLSAGYTGSFFSQSDKEISELGYSLTSHNLHVGLRINCNEHWNLDLGYLHTFYTTRDVTKDEGYKLHFERTNDVLGIGVTCAY